MRVTYLEQDAPRGLAHAVLLGESFMGDNPFVMYLGDNFIMDGVRGITEQFAERGGDASILLAHVTNQHLDLEPIFHAIAADLHLRGRSKLDDVPSIQEMQQGKDGSHWIALARSEAPLGAIAADPEWLAVPLRPDAPVDRRFLWTDDYSSVLRVLRIW